MLTTSLKVAEFFGKNHQHVMRDIRGLIEQVGGVSKIGQSSMFTESTYINQQNKQQPMYVMNRDGFTLLAMGFTGKKAFQFKLEGADLKELRVRNPYLQISPMTRALYLWTKRGATRHAKMLIFSFLPAAFCDFFTASNDAGFSHIFLKISLQARFDGAIVIGERSYSDWGTEL